MRGRFGSSRTSSRISFVIEVDLPHLRRRSPLRDLAVLDSASDEGLQFGYQEEKIASWVSSLQP